jgi:outer membrane protein assembly factor BamE (lipoprotein component of BamABCDE complex)
LKNAITLLAGFLILNGCAAPSDSQNPSSKKANLEQLKIGMTTEQVVSLLGQPAQTKQLVTAEGTTVKWFYPESLFWTTGDAIRAGLQESAGQRHGQGLIALTFTNDKLSSIETESP